MIEYSVEIKHTSIDTIKRMCAATFGVTVRDIVSQRRNADAVMARQCGMWLARRLTELSLPQIGRLFGGRDHTTVLHAISRVEQRIIVNDDRVQPVLDIYMQLKRPDLAIQGAVPQFQVVEEGMPS
jgi:chromosomal replication initiator protein